MENTLIIAVLIGNTCFALVYFLYMFLRKKNLTYAGITSVMILFVPVVGVAFLMISKLLDVTLFRIKTGKVNEEDMSADEIYEQSSPDVEREVDCIPIGEAMLLSNTNDRRERLLDILKRSNVENFVNDIGKTMSHDDLEVVHYAAAYISDAIARYKANEKQLRNACEAEDETLRIANMQAYLRYSDDMLHKNVFVPSEQLSYLMLFEQCAEKLLKLNPSSLESPIMAHLIDMLETAGQEEHVVKWVAYAEERMDTSLEIAKHILQFYYRTGDKERFFDTLARIKSSSLLVDAEMIEWIRFY